MMEPLRSAGWCVSLGALTGAAEARCSRGGAAVLPQGSDKAMLSA